MPECTCHDVLIVKNLNRWFKEKWVDVSRKDKDGKHPPCGRSKAKKGSKGYPKCRPSVKVSSKTPKTSGEMTSGQKRAATKRKRAKKQGVGGKPTIVKFDSEKNRDIELLGHMFDYDRMPPLSEMNERQRGVAQAALNLPSSYLAEEGWDGAQYNHLFSEGHEQIPDHEYARLQQALYQYAHEIEMHMNSPHTDKGLDFLDESNSDHPEHPWKIARDLAGKAMEEPLSVYPESFSDTMTGEPMDIAWQLLKRDLSEMTDYEIDRARFANDNQELESEERTRAMDRMAEFARQNVTPFDYGDEVEEAYHDIGDQDHSDYFGEDIDPNELYHYILENAGEEAAQNYIQQYKDARAKYGGNAATLGQLDTYGINNQGDANDFIESRERMVDDMRNIMPNDETVFDAFPYPEGIVYNNKLSPPFTTTPENESNFQMKYASEPMDLAWRLLKDAVSPEAKRHKLEYDKKYESSPERVKYREELNRERRKRGIYGHGGPDMSHTKDHTLVAESPHANRARHFKERGTLKG